MYSHPRQTSKQSNLSLGRSLSKFTPLILFYIVSFIIYYGSLERVRTLFTGIFSGGIASRPVSPELYLGALSTWGLPLVLTFGLVYLISKQFLGGVSSFRLGIRRKNLVNAFLYGNAINILSLIGLPLEVHIIGFSSVAFSLERAGVPTTPLWLAAPFSLLIVFVVGILAYPLWMAFPASFLRKTRPLVRNALVTALWIMLFDGSYIIMGKPPEPGDLLIFGFAFLLLYYKFENSIGILLAYVITGEWVLLAVPASLGQSVFDVFLYARMAVSLGSLGFLAYKRHANSRLNQSTGSAPSTRVEEI